MIKEIENCFDINILKEKKKKKENSIKKSNLFIDECDIRIEQLRFENKNQIRLEDF